MGNQPSVDAPDANDAANAQSSSLPGGDDWDSVPRVFVSPELQEAVLKDFNNKLLNEQWATHQAAILERAQTTHDSLTARQLQVHQQLEEFQKTNEPRQMQLQTNINRANERFDEVREDVQGKVAGLKERLGDGPPKVGGGGEEGMLSSCGEEREHLAACFRIAGGSVGSSDKCKGLIDVFDYCVTKAVVSKS